MRSQERPLWPRFLGEERVRGKRDSIHHHLLEVMFETSTIPELRQKLCTPPLWVVVVVYRIGLPSARGTLMYQYS